MQEHRHPYAGWGVSALACALLACALPVIARVVAGQPGADIHVAWQPSVDEAARRTLETRFRLDNPRKHEDTYTWTYDLTVTSSDNIRALVRDPAVRDTHEIDRNRFTLEPTAPRTARRQRFPQAGAAISEAADVLAMALLALAGLTCATRTASVRLLQRGIPELNAGTAGLFRILFGSVVVAFFASHRVDASWLDATFDLEIEGPLHAAVLDWLRGRPGIVDLLTPWILATGVAFTAGIFTRLTYSLFVAGVIVWAYVAISLDSTHPHSTLVLTLVALLPSRWGDALSIDAWLRRLRGRESAAGAAGTQYGYSVWVPGLVLGVAFAASAWAKLSVPPGWTDWILNGTIRYHLVTDSMQAPVDWGLQLVGHLPLAILASFFAVATEALLVTTAFAHSNEYRLALGMAAWALFAGFYTFMGVFWPGWWILLLGFLPWRRLGTYMGAARQPPREPAVIPPRQLVSAAQFLIIVGIIAQQIVVSTVKIERAPMFSWYDMYSGTYASPTAYKASRQPIFRVIATTSRGRVELHCNPHGEFVSEFQEALRGSPTAKAAAWRALSGCGEDLVDARDVTLEGDVLTFDWNSRAFVLTPGVVILGPLAAKNRAVAPPSP